MSYHDFDAAVRRLEELGVDVSKLHQDYYKIPLENIDLTKVERKVPGKEKITNKHTIIIDSRARDYSIYPNPNCYLIELMETHKNVERIELIAAMLPKTEYNVNTENNCMIVTIGQVTRQIVLTEGQYLIGTNSVGYGYISNGSPVINGLLLEIQTKLNTHPMSSNGFNVFLATVPPPNGTGPNASVLNRIVITNDTSPFSIDFTNSNSTLGSPFRLFGFPKTVVRSAIGNQIYGSSDTGICTPSDIIYSLTIHSVVASFDYDLLDDPKYLIMQAEFGNKSADRIESIDISSNQKFAVVIYDNNDSDTLVTTNNNQNYISQQIVRPPGRLKALKGQDFDKKVLTFDPSITLENFKITFYKYDNTLYNFHNREHLLMFELDIADYDPRYRY